MKPMFVWIVHPDRTRMHLHDAAPYGLPNRALGVVDLIYRYRWRLYSHKGQAATGDAATLDEAIFSLEDAARLTFR